MLEVAQPAMDELGGGRRSAGGEVVLLDQQDAQPAAGGIARDAGPVDAAANDGKVEFGRTINHRRLLLARTMAPVAASAVDLKPQDA